MKRFLLVALLELLLVSLVAQQQWISTVTFDNSGDSLSQFNVYPDSLWQVGAPSKTRFDSAYSTPYALVTDTIYPYGLNADTSYAELAIPYYRDMTGWLPEGANIEISFQYKADMNISSSRGWVELFQDSLNMPYANSFGWKRWQDFEWFDGSPYGWSSQALDSNGNFTGVQNLGWSTFNLWLGCHGLFNSNLEFYSIDTLKMRFAFSRSSNPNLRDGWMIDDITVNSYPCSPGSIDEYGVMEVLAFPIPTNRLLNLRVDAPLGSRVRYTVLNHSGQQVMEKDSKVNRSSETIDISDLPNGFYSLHIQSENETGITKFVVQH